jgi:glycosyltransferase involved in cell wall biosynthesis
MKVLMLSKACIVGAYQRKLEEIAALGVNLTVVVPPFWKDERGAMPLEKKFLAGYRLVVLPMRFNGHFHIHHYPEFSSLLREVRPDIVHIDEEPWDYVTYRAVRSASALGARPLFFTWQNLLRHYPPPFRWFEQYVFKHCRFGLAGNSAAVGVLRAKGFSGEVTVIPQFGVDPLIFAPAVDGSPPTDQPFTIGYAGRFIPVKGIDTLLRAAARLPGDWHVRLAGSGPELEALRQLAAELGIVERVSFDRQISSGEMPRFYRQIDCLVLPSRCAHNWVEQFGRVLVEAMASGVPVIGSDTGEIPNTIGDAGLLFKEDDVDGLAAQLERVRSDKPLRLRLIECGRARALGRFTQASVACQTTEIYRQMMA